MGSIKIALKAVLIAGAFYLLFEAMLTIIKTMVDAQENAAKFTQRVDDHGD